MASDRRRAALLACCALAIVAAASLFPAAGYGDYPDSGAVDSDHYEDGDSVGTPPAGNANDSSSGDDENATETETDEPARTGTETEREPGTETERETETEMESGTETETSSGTESNDDALAALFALLFAGGLGVAFWKLTDPTRASGVSEADLPAGFLPRLRLRFRRIPQLTMMATIGAARVAPSLLDRIAAATRGVGAGAVLVARSAGRDVGSTLLTAPSLFAGGLPSLSGGFTGLFGRSRSGSRRSWPFDRSSEPAREADPAPEPTPENPRTVEGAWEAMVEELPVRRRDARTPGEYASVAVDAGLPERAVARLTEAFREVRYGGYPPSPERTRRARDALETIERNRRKGGDDE